MQRNNSSHVGQAYFQRVFDALDPYIAELQEQKHPQLRLVQHVFSEFREKRDLVWLLRALPILSGEVREKCFVLVVEASDVMVLTL